MTAALSRNAEEYLSWLDVERGLSPRTLASYRRDLVGYQSFVEKRASGAHIDEATADEVAAYIAAVEERMHGYVRKVDRMSARRDAQFSGFSIK